MANRQWIRLDVDFEDSDWLVDLDPLAQFAWVKFLCRVKAEGSGGQWRKRSVTALHRRLALPVTAVVEMLAAATAGDEPALTEDDGDWVVTGWEKYYPQDRTNAIRQRNFRERRKVDSEVPLRNDSNAVTPVDVMSRATVDVRRKTNTERDTDVSANATTSGASAAVDNSNREPNGTADPADETVHQRFMPILREAGFNADNTDGSILKRLNEQGRRWVDIEAAILGLAYGRDHGMLRESHNIEPGDPLNLRLLYAKNKTTNPPLWTDAIDTWYPAWLRSQDEIANGARRKSEWGVRI